MGMMIFALSNLRISFSTTSSKIGLNHLNFYANALHILLEGSYDELCSCHMFLIPHSSMQRHLCTTKRDQDNSGFDL